MPKIAELPAHNSDFCGKSIGRALPPFSSAYRYYQLHRKSFPICPAGVQNASVFVRAGRSWPRTVCKFPAKPELFLKISFFSPYCDFCNRHTVFPLLSYFSYSVGKETAHGLYAFGRSADRRRRHHRGTIADRPADPEAERPASGRRAHRQRHYHPAAAHRCFADAVGRGLYRPDPRVYSGGAGQVCAPRHRQKVLRGAGEAGKGRAVRGDE